MSRHKRAINPAEFTAEAHEPGKRGRKPAFTEEMATNLRTQFADLLAQGRSATAAYRCLANLHGRDPTTIRVYVQRGQARA